MILISLRVVFEGPVIGKEFNLNCFGIVTHKCNNVLIHDYLSPSFFNELSAVCPGVTAGFTDVAADVAGVEEKIANRLGSASDSITTSVREPVRILFA